jgi:type VI secretion system secreted protein Hcp
MGSRFLMSLTLKKQGQFKGQPTKSTGGKGLSCHSFEYPIVTQYDLQGQGQPKGKRGHSPLTIVRETDSASPLLWQALVSNEAFAFLDIDILETRSSGEERLANRITLTNATIREIKPYLEPGVTEGGNLHRLVFDYGQIAMTPPVPAPSLMQPSHSARGLAFRPSSGAGE